MMNVKISTFQTLKMPLGDGCGWIMAQAALSASTFRDIEFNTTFDMAPVDQADLSVLVIIRAQIKRVFIPDRGGPGDIEKRICEIGCGATGEAFVPQSWMKGLP